MDVQGNNGERDVWGHEPHDVFGGPSNANVYGSAPTDVWGSRVAAEFMHEAEHQYGHYDEWQFADTKEFFFGDEHYE